MSASSAGSNAIRVDRGPVAALKETRIEILRFAMLSPHIAVAMVAPRDYMFGLARSWEALVDGAGWQTGVFQTLPDAEAWLQTIHAASR